MPDLTQEELDRRLNAFREACRQAGLKLTHQRLEIYREVASTDEHPDVECIYQRVRDRLPTVSLDTVYRTLTTLAEVGVIQEVNVLGNRSRYDANMAPHHHFVCTRCRAIHDFAAEAPTIDRLPADLAEFGEPTSVHLQVRGTCRQCQEGRQR